MKKTFPCLGKEISDYKLDKIKNNQKPFISNSYFIPNKAITQNKSIYKCNKNEFVLFHGINDKRIGIGRNLEDSKEGLIVLYDGNMNIEPYAKIGINQVDENKLNSQSFYRNYFEHSMLNLQRIRTRADILYVINAFNNNPYDIVVSFMDSSLRAAEKQSGIPDENASNNIISDYDEPHKYYRRSSDRLSKSIRLKGTTEVCLYFNGKNRILTEDYARYVLSYLNERYPEFHWIGRYEE